MSAPPQFRTLLSSREIAALVDKCASDIVQYARQHAKQTVVVVGVLHGAVFFVADLVRAMESMANLTLDVRIGFCKVSTYGAGTQQSRDAVTGKVTFMLADYDLRHAPSDETLVVIADELLDNGLTMHLAMKSFSESFPPYTALSCALFRKDKQTEFSPLLDFGGHVVPDVWLVGYGLDDGGSKRGLRDLTAKEMS